MMPFTRFGNWSIQPSTGPGQLPLDLVAGSDLCSIAAEQGNTDELAVNLMAFYHDLTGGKWLLEAPRYAYSADRCQSWSRESPVTADEFRRLEAIEKEKLALTLAVEKLLTKPSAVLRVGNRTHLAFWQSDPLAGIVLSESFLESRWWPRVFSIGEEQDLAAALCSSDGRPALGFFPENAPPFAVTSTIPVSESQWHLQVWPRHPGLLYSDLKQKQNLYKGMLIFIGRRRIT